MLSFAKGVLAPLLLVLLAFKSYSGTIKGSVTDKETGEPMAGAIVMLQGTSYGVAAGLDGSYVLKNIPTGSYELQVKFTSFETFTKHIDLRDAETQDLNIQLTASASTLKEVEIKAKLKNGSDEQARNLEKNSDNLLNIMSARTIELLPDIQVANVLQRVSGIQVERDANGEARYAAIRGMDKRYNYTTVNGIKIPSPDDKGRFVPLDIFPAEILDRVEVIKSLTPDMEGDAIGGVTNLVMKKAPDQPLIYASAATGYNNNSFQEHFNSFDHGAVVETDPTRLHGAGYGATVADFPRGSSIMKPIQTPPNDLFSLSLGNRFLKDKKLGVMVSGSYQNTYKVTNNLFIAPAAQPDLNNIDEFDDMNIRKYSTQETRTGLNTNIDYRFNEKNSITLYGLFVQLNKWENRYVIDTAITGINRTGPGLGNVDYSDRTTFTRSNIGNVTLKGDHIIANGLKLDWTGAYSKATKDVPDYTELTSEDAFSTSPQTGLITERGLQFKSMSKTWETTNDQDAQGFLNLTYNPAVLGGNVELKGGGMYRSKYRDNYYNKYDFEGKKTGIGDPAFTNVQNLNDSNVKLKDSLGTAYGEWLTYKEHENITGYYLQAKIHLMDNRLEVLGGARIEHTHVEDTSDRDPKNDPAVANKYDYTDLLPGLHLKYKLSNKENIRLSYFESITRPGFFELINYTRPGEAFDESGNPYLNHSTAQNVDARYEWFPKGIDQLLVGAFYKNIANPIEYFIARIGGPSTQQIQPQNVPGNAINYGTELVITKYFHYFGVSANYTYTHSAITVTDIYYGDSSGQAHNFRVNVVRPLQGQAAHIGNVALIYKNPKMGLDAHLSLQYTGRHIALASGYEGLDYWQKATSFLDFSCDKRIAKHLSVYAKVNNILNSPTIVEMNESNKKFTDPTQPSFYLSYQTLKDGKTLVEKTQTGTNYLVGIRYKFD